MAEQLRALGVTAEICSGEALELIEAWHGDDDVVVVDSVETGSPPGTIWLWDGRTANFPAHQPVSSHGLGLSAAMRLARILGRLPKRMRVYGIEGRRFDHGFKVSPALRVAVDQVVRRIRATYGSGASGQSC